MKIDETQYMLKLLRAYLENRILFLEGQEDSYLSTKELNKIKDMLSEVYN